MGLRSSAWITLMLALGACGQPASLTAQVVSDMVTGVEIDAIDVALVGSETRQVTRELDAFARLDRAVRLAEFFDLAPGPYVLRYTARRGDHVVLEESRPVMVVGATLRTVLLARQCRGVACPGDRGNPTDTACLAGVCVAETCDEEHPELCDAPRACADDADCLAMASCARATCSASGQCVVSGDASLCGDGEYCDGTAGCRDLATDRACEVAFDDPDAASDSTILDCAHARRLRACWVDDTTACGPCACDAYITSTEVCEVGVTCHGSIEGNGCLIPGGNTAPPFSCDATFTLDQTAVCVVRGLFAMGLCDGVL